MWSNRTIDLPDVRCWASANQASVLAPIASLPPSASYDRLPVPAAHYLPANAGFHCRFHCWHSNASFPLPTSHCRPALPASPSTATRELLATNAGSHCQPSIASVQPLSWHCRPRPTRLTTRLQCQPRITGLALPAPHYRPRITRLATTRLALLASHCQLPTARPPMPPPTAAFHCQLCIADLALPALHCPHRSTRPASPASHCQLPTARLPTAAFPLRPSTASLPAAAFHCQPRIANLALPTSHCRPRTAILPLLASRYPPSNC